MSDAGGLRLSRRRRLPMTMSAEASECGLACMAMIAAFYGHDIDLNGLRQRISFSIAGATLRSLIGLADELGFASRALRIELEDLRFVRTPAILHVDTTHFVVLKAVARDGRLTIHDPSRGVQTLAPAEMSKHFTGVVLEVQPSARFEPVQARAPFRLTDLWSKAQGLAGATAQVLALSAALQIALFVLPLFLQLIVDQSIARSDESLLTVLCLGFGGVLLFQAVASALRSWSVVILANMFIFQLVGNLVRHLLRLPGSFFEKRHVGDILSRIGSTAAVRDAFTQGVVTALLDGLIALAISAVLFFYSPLLAVIVIGALALNVAISFGFFGVIRARTEEQLIASGHEQSHLMESVRAAAIIKLMGREAEREGRWRNLYARVINATASTARYQTVAVFLQDVVTAAQTVLVIGLGARMVLSGGGFSVGMLLAFVTYRQMLTDRAASFIAEAVKFRLLGLHLSRIADIATATPEPRAAARAAAPAKGAIELRDVAFRYGAADATILEGVNLRIEPGQLIAIVGPSGGGKTTLLKLLLGLQEPTQGEIFLDGEKATPGTWRAWRESIGVVMQDDRLFTGSIASNIAFFDPDLDMEKIVRAAAAAHIEDDINRLPMRYSSLVGDMGSALSGGQKQRILLARALYRAPRLLFLDEGTANLDEKTEKLITDLVVSLPITRIVIAHRPALVNRATRVLRVQDKTLTEIAEPPLGQRVSKLFGGDFD